MAEVLASLPPAPTMRDINDACVAHGIPSLAQGMIEIPPPVALRQLAGEVALRDDIHTYRDRMGDKSFREAMQVLLKREYGAEFPVECILAVQAVSGGVVSTFSTVAKRFPGETFKVGFIQPFYTYHQFQLKGVVPNSEIKFISLKEPSFQLDFDAIERTLREGLHLLLLVNPNNPTGQVYGKEDISRLVRLTREHNCVLLLDECYCDMHWGGAFWSPLSEGVGSMEDHVVVVRGFSKVLGCQSWRVGYLVSTAKTCAETMRSLDPIYLCAPWLQQVFGEYINRHPTGFSEHRDSLNKVLLRNWKVLSSAFKDALGWEPIEPDGTMYGMFRHKNESDIDACKEALEAKVGVCPGSMFLEGFPALTGYTRIHCGVTEEKADQCVKNLMEYKRSKM